MKHRDQKQVKLKQKEKLYAYPNTAQKQLLGVAGARSMPQSGKVGVLFSGGGASSKRNELSVGIPDRTKREWTATPVQGEMGIKWNRPTTQIIRE